MAKEITAQIKLQCPGGSATPAPPVGPALGAHGVAIGEFVKQFNDATQDKRGLISPVVITVYADRSFSFITKTPPASVLIRRAAGIAKGSGVPNVEKVGKIDQEQLRQIAEIKLPDLNCDDVEAAMNIVAGTARSMGVNVAD